MLMVARGKDGAASLLEHLSSLIKASSFCPLDRNVLRTTTDQKCVQEAGERIVVDLSGASLAPAALAQLSTLLGTHRGCVQDIYLDACGLDSECLEPALRAAVACGAEALVLSGNTGLMVENMTKIVPRITAALGAEGCNLRRIEASLCSSNLKV